MSENFDELGELGDKIKKIIDTAVSTKDYRQMTEDIKPVSYTHLTLPTKLEV